MKPLFTKKHNTGIDLRFNGGLFDVILWQLIFLEACRISAYLMPHELKFTSFRNCQHQYFPYSWRFFSLKMQVASFYHKIMTKAIEVLNIGMFPQHQSKGPPPKKAIFFPVKTEESSVVNNLSNCGRMFLVGDGWPLRGQCSSILMAWWPSVGRCFSRIKRAPLSVPRNDHAEKQGQI